MAPGTHWGSAFDPDELARLETRMWKAYYRRQPVRLFGLLVMAIRAQAHVSWPRALGASVLLTRAAAGFARSTGDYERFAPDIVRSYRMLGLPEHVDIEAVARHELRWWVVRREIGLAAGTVAGDVDHRPVRGSLRRPSRACRGSRPAARDRGGDPRSRRGGRPGRTARPGHDLLARGRAAAPLVLSKPEPGDHRAGGAVAGREGDAGRGRDLTPRSTYLSSGRRPMSHQATGKMPAATRSLNASQAMNGVRPPLMVSAIVRCRL